MATNTTNYGWTKPDYEDDADIAVLNETFDAIDAQVKTNENNILSLYTQGVKNIAKPNTISAISGITIVQNLGHYEISGTTGGSQYTAYLCTPTEDIIATEELYIPAAATRTNVSYLCHWKNTRDKSQYSIIGTGLIIPQGCKIHAIYMQVAANTTFSLNVDMMICKKAIYDADNSYQPYAMSNAELTAKEQQNENNISTDRAALVELVDAGAKNIIELGDAICEKNGVTAVLSSDGSIVLSGKTEGATSNFLIINDLKTGSQTVSYASLIPIKSGIYTVSGVSDSRVSLQVLNYNSSSDVDTFDSDEFTATKQYIDFRLIVRRTADFTTPLTIYPMCCTKAEWDISHAYQPYRPSYQELYERVIALEQANA